MQNLDGCATDDILDVDGTVADDITQTSGVIAVENHPATAISKRILDIAVSSALIVFVLPALILVSILIRATSPGPILFRQRRSGLNGEAFEVLKFRTMFCTENGEEIRHATRRDARVTPLGAVLRATSIDELPQLFNVLRGDMSLVGPRPHALAHDRHYALLVADYMKRFAVRPGITGLAQIRGLRGEIHDLSCMERRVRADCEYIERWSLAFDLAIILKTIPRMVRDPNAY